MGYDNRNLFLGIFASKPIRKQVITKALRERSFVISYPYFLYKDEMAEAENIETNPMAKSIWVATEPIGLERAIKEMESAR